MNRYQDFLSELRGEADSDTKVMLVEKAMQFNKNRNNKFGNIVILAGGAGSGKGASLKHIIAMDGKVLDVDALKVAASKAPMLRKQMIERFGPESVGENWMKNPENVSKLHLFLNDEKVLPDKQEAALFASIMLAAPDRKPNLIFDITLKDLTKIANWGDRFKMLGYDSKNVNLVWVLNTFEIAASQNKQRNRTVSEKILLATHNGASYSMKQILDGTFDVRGIVDGDVYINFNQAGVDNKIKKSGDGGSYMETANYIKIKSTGQPIDKKKVDEQLIAKIKQYVPNPEIWK